MSEERKAETAVELEELEGLLRELHSEYVEKLPLRRSSIIHLALTYNEVMFRYLSSAMRLDLVESEARMKRIDDLPQTLKTPKLEDIKEFDY